MVGGFRVPLPLTPSASALSVAPFVCKLWHDSQLTMPLEDKFGSLNKCHPIRAIAMSTLGSFFIGGMSERLTSL
ncbi:hypothetical protein VCHA43P273_280041 [Vibrio chagasii]|nr:hypothetical protein VCHA27O13_60200 [Vibrio chagasii]CAH6889120.1 hypothetical protein VCHA40O235_100013 [Vibrio chagasii]CAH7068504.1 hypothetical protein VCHA40P240_10193 [Vibrio chagasii]CAH7154624.1 hypothetical protein VCHA43P273_280041 [Vibrio chagasii]CAH7349127.1 hypothetical protein VCHA43O270_50171 [Vibrio chagasii]